MLLHPLRFDQQHSYPSPYVLHLSESSCVLINYLKGSLINKVIFKKYIPFIKLFCLILGAIIFTKRIYYFIRLVIPIIRK
jgi:hypothetical protein